MFGNVQFFVRLHLKVCNKCYYDPNSFFLEKYQYGVKNAELLADFKFIDARYSKLLKKIKSKNHAKKFRKKQKYSKFTVFWM